MYEHDKFTTAIEEDDVLLPEGWAEGDDLFDEASWSGSASPTDEPGVDAEPAAEEVAVEGEEQAPTTEPGADPGDGAGDEGVAPTTEQDPGTQATNKLKFTARVDRADLDVEVDESELPSLYQKAQATERYQAKLAKLTPQLEKVERLAKTMGFETIDDMIASAESSYRDTEVSRLVGEGVHEEVAKDMVARRIQARDTAGGAEVPDSQTTAISQAPTSPAKRDFAAEVSELLEQRTDLVGTTIPSEVVNACVRDGKRLIVAYAEYEARAAKAENERLAKKVKVMEQNASAAARSPVAGVSGGGPTDTKPKSDFEKGFDSIWD